MNWNETKNYAKRINASITKARIFVGFFILLFNGLIAQECPEIGIIIFCPTDTSFMACESQADIDMAFINWTNGFMKNCGTTETPIPSEPPSVCTGDTIVYVFTVSDGGESISCTSTFAVAAPPPLIVNAPPNTLMQPCLSQATIDMEFDLWLDEFNFTGGCSPNESGLTFILNIDSCIGGSRTVTYSVQDICQTISLTSTFEVGTPQSVQVSCALDEFYPSCEFSSQVNLNAAFSAWIGSFSVIDYGCGGTPNDLSNYTPPDICTGGIISIEYTFDDGCSQDTCNSSFEVEGKEPIVVTCPDPLKDSGCQDPNASFLNWLTGFSFSGGCDPLINYNVEYADGSVAVYQKIEDFPLILGCNSVKVIYSVQSILNCSFDDCTSTYIFEPESMVQVLCPPNVTINDSCENYEEAYLDWASNFSYTGGCEPVTEILAISVNGSKKNLIPDIASGIAYLPPCGGTVTIYYDAMDFYGCSKDECSATMTVIHGTPVVLNCPKNEKITSCNYSLTSFQNWIDGFYWSGGCDIEVICCIRYDDGPLVIVTSLDALSPPNLCGGKINITIKVTTDCEATISCTSTFEIIPGGVIKLNCPGNITLPSCLDESEIHSVFTEWINSFSHTGGCSTESQFVGENPTPPHFCGGSTEVVYLVSDKDGCQEDQFCSAVFTIEKVDELILNCPDDLVINTCLDQSEIDDLYASWLLEFGYKGSCAPNAIFSGGSPLPPDACGGQATVIFEVPSNKSCFVKTSCTRTFSVILNAPQIIYGDTTDIDLGINEDFPSESQVSGFDQCNLPLIINIEQEMSQEVTLGIETLMRTWTAQSDCFEKILATQIITRVINDSTRSGNFLCYKVELCQDVGACTMTQELFASDSIGFCSDNSVVEIMEGLISNDHLTIGLPGNSFTIAEDDVSCLFMMLGNSEGLSAILGDGDAHCSQPNFDLDSNGKIFNPLVSEALTLGLNLRLNKSLADLIIENRCIRTVIAKNCNMDSVDWNSTGEVDTFCFPEEVMNKFESGFTVEELKMITDSALVGFDIGLNLEDLAATLKFVNVAFASCRVIKDFINLDFSKEASPQINLKKMDLSILNELRISPNPVTHNFNIDVQSDKGKGAQVLIRNHQGSLVYTQDVRLVKGMNKFQLSSDLLPQGIYLLQIVDKYEISSVKFIKM